MYLKLLSLYSTSPLLIKDKKNPLASAKGFACELFNLLINHSY